MATKIGTTIVIDSSGDVPWSVVNNRPGFVTFSNELEKQASVYISDGPGPYSGYSFFGLEFTSGTAYRNVYKRYTV